MADPTDIGGPLWWLQRMETRLRMRRTRIQIYDDYFSGRHRLAFATPKFREAFGGLFNELADDWCQLVVDAVAERCAITGFRIGVDAEDGDKDAWRIFQVNKLDAGSRMGHVESLVREESAVIVWFGDKSTADEPKITVEDPSQVWVEFTDSSRATRAAALKMWTDEDGHELATVYLPGAIYKYRSSTPPIQPLIQDLRQNALDRPSGGAGTTSSGIWLPGSYVRTSGWEERYVSNEPWPLPNKLGVVPVVPLTNRPRLARTGESEIRGVIPVQDLINKLVADTIVTSEYQSFRQRVLIGWDVPVDPVTKKPLPNAEIVQAASRLWATSNKDAKVLELGQVDLTGYIKAIEMFVQHVASQTRTPPHYFYLSGHFPSGESIKSAETGLVSKVREKQLHWGEAWEEVIRLAFRIKGDAKGEEYQSETVWRDPESRTEAEHIDATVKKLALGVPQKQLWLDAGYSPAQIQRFEGMLDEQLTRKAELMKELAAMMPSASAGGGSGPGASETEIPEVVPGAPVDPVIAQSRNRVG